MIENLNMSGEIYIGDFGEYSTGVDTLSFDNFTATIHCSDFPACFLWHFVLLIVKVTLTGQTGISQVTRNTLSHMQHRLRRENVMTCLRKNRASAIGCLSLCICSPSGYSCFIIISYLHSSYHNGFCFSLTSCLRTIFCYDALLVSLLLKPAWLLAFFRTFVSQFRYSRLLCCSWLKLPVEQAITVQDFHLLCITIPWHTMPSK